MLGIALAATATSLELPTLVQPSPAAAAGATDWAKVRADIAAVMAGTDEDRGPTLVRLAWHSSGTYDRMTKTGGSGGATIRFKEELAHGANAGLDKAVAWLEPIKQRHPTLSYADLYTLSGVVAIKSMNGPDIPWRAGRMDGMDPSAVTPDGRLPAADKGSPGQTAAGIRSVFNRMGFNDQEIVALSGAHALGRCHADASGYVGPWTGTPTIWTNAYYTLLLKLKWEVDDRYPKLQYRDSSGNLMMLPSDLVLIQDPEFKKYVEIYSKDAKQFDADFTMAFQKLEELGTTNLYEL